jgi:hypothetical protein
MSSILDAMREPKDARCAICGFSWGAGITFKTYGDSPDYPVLRTERVDPGPRMVLRHVHTDLNQEDHSVHRLCLLALQKACAKNLWPRECPACSKHFLPILTDEEPTDVVMRLIEPALATIRGTLFTRAMENDDTKQMQRLQASGVMY